MLKKPCYLETNYSISKNIWSIKTSWSDRHCWKWRSTEKSTLKNRLLSFFKKGRHEKRSKNGRRPSTVDKLHLFVKILNFCCQKYLKNSKFWKIKRFHYSKFKLHFFYLVKVDGRRRCWCLPLHFSLVDCRLHFSSRQ